MRKQLILLLLLLVAPAWTQGKTLYLRLGGYDAIAAVTDDFLAQMVADAQLRKYFVGHSKDSMQRIRQHIVDQLVYNTGGPAKYKGRDMTTAHKGLKISKDEYRIAVNLLGGTLDKFKVKAPEKDEVLALVGSLEDEIVEASR